MVRQAVALDCASPERFIATEAFDNGPQEGARVESIVLEGMAGGFRKHGEIGQLRVPWLD